MKKISITLAIIFCISCAITLSGCENNPISSIVIANEQYNENASIENAAQATELSKSKDIYASIYFIETPKGMKYSANWYLDGQVIKTDEQEMPTNQHGVIAYKLEADKIKEGKLKLEVKYKDNILIQKEINIK